MNARTKTALCAVAKAVTLHDAVFAHDCHLGPSGNRPSAPSSSTSPASSLSSPSWPSDHSSPASWTSPPSATAAAHPPRAGVRSRPAGPRWTPAVSKDPYALDKSLRSDEDPEPSGGIVRTTGSRVSEHTSEGIGVQCMEDRWAAPCRLRLSTRRTIGRIMHANSCCCC